MIKFTSTLHILSAYTSHSKVKLMDLQHDKQTKRIIEWCNEYRQLIETLGTNIENIATVHSRI